MEVFLLDNFMKHKLLISEEWDILEEAMAENRTTQTAWLAQNLPNLKGINFPFNYVLHLQPSCIQNCQILGCMSTASPVFTELKTSVA